MEWLRSEGKRYLIRTSTAPKGEIRPDLGIDLGTFRCGTSNLTRREHQILGLLNRHFGLVVAWQRLIDMLYAGDEHGGPENPKNVVSVVVCALRRKMLPTGYQLVTVHNEGLMLRHRDHLERRSATAADRADGERCELC